jgi:hypothetical protein
MLNSYLVANQISNKTLGSVYAMSMESAQNIASALWINDKDALVLFDLRKKFDETKSGKSYLM